MAGETSPERENFACALFTLRMQNIKWRAGTRTPIPADIGDSLTCMYVDKEGTACGGIAWVVQSTRADSNLDDIILATPQGRPMPLPCRHTLDFLTDFLDGSG